jgi:hypothetical protein
LCIAKKQSFDDEKETPLPIPACNFHPAVSSLWKRKDYDVSCIKMKSGGLTTGAYFVPLTPDSST